MVDRCARDRALTTPRAPAPLQSREHEALDGTRRLGIARTGCPSEPVDRRARPRRARERGARALARRRRLRREPAPPRGRAGVGLLRGPAHRQRPARDPPRLGPARSRTSTPASTRCAASYVARKGGWDCHGLPVEVEVEKELGFTGKQRDRGLRHRRVQPAVPRVGAALRRGLVERSRRASACGSTPTTPTGRSTTSTSRASGGCSARCGTTATSTRATRSSPTAAAAAPRCRATSSASPARTRTSPSRRSTCASPSSTATSTCSCGPPRRGRCSRTSRAAVGPDVAYVRVREPRRRARPRARGATRVADGARRRRRGRRRRSRSPSSSACTTSGRSTTSPLDADGDARAGRRRRVRHRRRRLRHRAPRARVRRDRPRGRRARGPPDAQPGRRRRRRSSTQPPVRRAVREGRRPRAHRRARAPRAGSCASSTTRTRTRTAGAAARRSSTGRSPRGSRAPSAHKDELLRENEAHRLAPRAHQARPLRRLAREQRRLGAVARPVLGHADPGLALRRLRPRHVRRLGGRARRARRPRPRRPRPAPARRRRRRRSPARSATAHAPPGRAGARRVVRLGLDAGGAVPLPVREHRTLFERRFPADFICEAIDQTRGWFYSLLAVNTLVFDRTPYRNVVCLALIVDKDGQKMSKSKRQRHRPVDDPRRPRRRRAALELLLRRLAVDADAACRSRGIDESTRRFLLTLWNTYSFFVTYANLDGWEPARRHRAARARRTCSTGGSARGCTARSHAVTDALEAFDALRGAQALERLRRRPLELVRAPLTPAVLERRPTPTRARDAARVPRAPSRCCSRRSARSSPTRCTRNLARDRRVGAPRRLARRRRRRDRRRPRGGDGARARRSCRSASRRAPRRSSGCASRCAARSCSSRAASRSPTTVARRDRRRAEREGARARHRPRRPARLHGRARTSARSARRSGTRMPLVKERARRRRRRRGPPRARRRRHATTLELGDGRRSTLDARRRRGARRRRTKSSRSPRTAAYAVALDTTLDDELRAEGIARELVRAINDHAQGARLRDRRPHPRPARRRPDACEAAARRAPRLDRGRGARGRVRRRGVRPTPSGAVAVEVDGEPVGAASSAAGLTDRATRVSDGGGSGAGRSLGLARRRTRPARRRRAERRVVADRVAQRGEERVVVERVGVDRVGLHRELAIANGCVLARWRAPTAARRRRRVGGRQASSPPSHGATPRRRRAARGAGGGRLARSAARRRDRPTARAPARGGRGRARRVDGDRVGPASRLGAPARDRGRPSGSRRCRLGRTPAARVGRDAGISTSCSSGRGDGALDRLGAEVREVGLDRGRGRGRGTGRELLERVGVGVAARRDATLSSAISASSRRRSLSAMRRAVASASPTSACALRFGLLDQLRARAPAPRRPRRRRRAARGSACAGASRRRRGSTGSGAGVGRAARHRRARATCAREVLDRRRPRARGARRPRRGGSRGTLP